MRNPFARISPQAKAERVVARHTAEVVCHHCGAGALVMVRNGNLVKEGNSYRHSSPRACALVIDRARRSA